MAANTLAQTEAALRDALGRATRGEQAAAEQESSCAARVSQAELTAYEAEKAATELRKRALKAEAALRNAQQAAGVAVGSEEQKSDGAEGGGGGDSVAGGEGEGEALKALREELAAAEAATAEVREAAKREILKQRSALAEAAQQLASQEGALRQTRAELATAQAQLAPYSCRYSRYSDYICYSRERAVIFTASLTVAQAQLTQGAQDGGGEAEDDDGFAEFADFEGATEGGGSAVANGEERPPSSAARSSRKKGDEALRASVAEVRLRIFKIGPFALRGCCLHHDNMAAASMMLPCCVRSTHCGTPSHIVTHRHTPSHAVTRRHMPSHAVTCRYLHVAHRYAAHSAAREGGGRAADGPDRGGGGGREVGEECGGGSGAGAGGGGGGGGGEGEGGGGVAAGRGRVVVGARARSAGEAAARNDATSHRNGVVLVATPSLAKCPKLPATRFGLASPHLIPNLIRLIRILLMQLLTPILIWQLLIGSS